MYPTRNDLPEATRGKVVELLDARLADAIDLASQLKQAHWNVRGPHFFFLHELFDKAYEQVHEHVDLIAERAVQLGGEVHGTARMAAQRSSLSEYAPKAADRALDRETAHVEAVASGLAAFGKRARAAIDQADELRDQDTADLFTEVSRDLDKLLWMVEAHLA